VLHACIVEALEALVGDRWPRWLLGRRASCWKAGPGPRSKGLAHHALRGEVWDKAPGVLAGQAGEKAHGGGRPTARPWGTSSRRSVPSHICQRDAIHASRPLISDFALRSALLPSGDLGRILALLHEAEASPRCLTTVVGWDRPVSFYQSISISGARMTRPSPPASAPRTRLQAGGDVVLQALANDYLGFAYHAQGDYRRAIDCFRQTVMSLDGAHAASASAKSSCPPVQSVLKLAVCHAELGTFAEGNALGEEGLQIAEAVAHPASRMWAYYGIGLLSLHQGDLHRRSPGSNAPWASGREAGLPRYFPLIAAALGAVYTRAGASPTPCYCSRRRWNRRLQWKR